MDPSGYGFFRWVARIVGAVVGFVACGPECAVTGAVIGFSIGDSVGSAIEGRAENQSSSQHSSGAPATARSPALPLAAPTALPGAGRGPSFLGPMRYTEQGAAASATSVEPVALRLRAARAGDLAQPLVEVYYRPLNNPLSKGVGGPGHLFIVYNNGQNLWELLGPNGKIHFNKPTGDQVQDYLKEWEGQLKGPLLVSVDPAKFGQALADQEALEGQSYYGHFFFNNSNFGVRWVINQSITYGIGPTPKGGFGWAPDFFGDPTK